MMTEEHCKEDLSRAFVQAIAAKAGMTVTIEGRGHDYGIDGQFHQISIFNGRYRETGINLDFQAKATTKFSLQEGYVRYALDASIYNMLSERSHRSRATPTILIVLCLPQESKEWFNLSEKALILKNCCYWMRIKGELTSNTSTITVQIPKDQLLSPDSLIKLLNSIEEREDWDVIERNYE